MVKCKWQNADVLDSMVDIIVKQFFIVIAISQYKLLGQTLLTSWHSTIAGQ